MLVSKANIIAQLQREILPLQGYKPVTGDSAFDAGLGRIKYAFPNAVFPTDAMHEFFCSSVEDTSATQAFVAGILSSLMRNGGAAVWISSVANVFPPALQLFGVEPDKMIFIKVKNEKERVWAMEEALKCDGLAAVIGDISETSFTASRRFQLAVEQSRVTGFIIRCNPKNIATACVSRWKITPLRSNDADGLPGIGFPRWNVELVKVRNGKPGTWQVEWADDRFQHVYKLASIITGEQRKVG